MTEDVAVRSSRSVDCIATLSSRNRPTLSSSYSNGVLHVRSRPARFPHLRLQDDSRQSIQTSSAVAAAAPTEPHSHREQIATDDVHAYVLGDNRETNRFRWLGWARQAFRNQLGFYDM